MHAHYPNPAGSAAVGTLTEDKDAWCLLDRRARVKPTGLLQWPAGEWNTSLSWGASALLEGKELGVEPNAHLGVSERDGEDIVRFFSLSDTTGSHNLFHFLMSLTSRGRVWI